MRLFKSVVAAAAVIGAFAGAPASAAVVITVENAGVTNTTAAGTFGIETFDTATAGFVTSFADTIAGVTFSYAGVDVRPSDLFGGVGGSQYAATYRGLNFAPYEQSNETYTLNVTSTSGPVNFFGAYFTAQDFNNQISFFKNNTLVSVFTPAVVLTAISGTTGYVDGNDLLNVFVNIYFNGGQTYDSIVFDAAGNGTGFESDNHTVGTYTPPITGTVVSGVVPEPATWTMMVTGFGLVGFSVRRRTRKTVAA